ncbi:MAG: hypothetical protein JXR91_09490 [Deltaproteobacteria bacterium]|nr:hypothetical protein [Deltaproteobacteria bacterium]
MTVKINIPGMLVLSLVIGIVMFSGNSHSFESEQNVAIPSTCAPCTCDLEKQLYKPAAAVSLSLIPTLVGFAVGGIVAGVSDSSEGRAAGLTTIGVSAVLFPGLGYFYIHEIKRGFKGIGFRFLMTGAGALVFHYVYPPLGGIILTVSLISVIVDMAVIKRKTIKKNEQLKKVSWGISPMIQPQKNGSNLGLMIQGTF